MTVKRSRIRSVIEDEVLRQLSFTFTLKRNLSRPGATDFRKGERVVFNVWARNDGDLPLKQISGVLSKTASATFRSTPFDLRGLDPREERVAATLEALILRDIEPSSDCQWIATLTVVTSVDLSDLRIQESERCIAYVPSRRLSATGGRPRFIPLSSAPPAVP
jgi:hypothetical protein